mgnify:CR=1 FL=1
MAKIKHETAKIAIDPVILTIHQNKLKVLLHIREKEPLKGLKELPGGLLLSNETSEESLKRKLKELVGFEDLFVKQFYTFTEPTRDPRERTISIGFLSLINQEKVKDLVRWYEYDSLDNLAFDHKKIIEAARNYLKDNIDPSIVKQFMPKLFPLNKLQEVYQILEKKEYDNRNFRKKMISSGIVEETNNLEENVSHRPAKLFRFK